MTKSKFFIPVYNAWVYLVVSENPAKDMSGLGHIFDGVDDDDYTACVYSSNMVFAIVFRPKYLAMSIVAHESVHLARAILSAHGIRPHKRTEEIECILVQYIVDQLVKRIPRSLLVKNVDAQSSKYFRIEPKDSKYVAYS